MKAFCPIFFILFTSLAASAQEGIYAGTELQNVLKDDVYEPNYFNLIFGLVFVIFLIYLTGFFYQKLIGVGSKINKKAQGQNCAANKVKILSSMPLGRSKNIYTVSVNGKTLVLGATENQITLLREFSEEEIAQYTKDLCDEEYDDE